MFARSMEGEILLRSRPNSALVCLLVQAIAWESPTKPRLMFDGAQTSSPAWRRDGHVSFAISMNEH